MPRRFLDMALARFSASPVSISDGGAFGAAVAADEAAARDAGVPGGLPHIR